MNGETSAPLFLIRKSNISSGRIPGRNARGSVSSAAASIPPAGDTEHLAETQFYLQALNPEQRSAVLHGFRHDGRSAPLAVIAGAGTGKTNTLAHRIAHLVASGADPQRILLLTFSRRASTDMRRRVEHILAGALRSRATLGVGSLSWAGTFHAIGARLIREHSTFIGLDPQFTILDRQDAADLLNLVRHDLGLSKTETRFPNKHTCLAIYSRVVNAKAELSDVVFRNFAWCATWEPQLRKLFSGYVDAKHSQNVLDFDDLLLLWASMMEDDHIAAALKKRFDYVLVDEYQDTNCLQSSILFALKPDGRGVTVVGDDAQSIYSFRAATVRNILDFPQQFSPPASVLTLERNYRSTTPILEVANAVMSISAEGFEKNLKAVKTGGCLPQLVSVRDETDQATFVAEGVMQNWEGGQALRNQAVLFRASHHSIQLELELARRGVPFKKYGGLRFLDAAHVKDLLSLLRFVENPRDRTAGFRLLQLVPGIGPAVAGRILDALTIVDGSVIGLGELSVPKRCEHDWKKLVKAVRAMGSSATGWPAEVALARAWYQPHLERIHEDARERLSDLAQLEELAAASPSRQSFLTDLTLDPPSGAAGETGSRTARDEHLVLSTIHSAKGLEWASVYILNAIDGCLPSEFALGSRDEMEEERRLLYVAITRAKDELTIVLPQRQFLRRQSALGDRYVSTARTRFITNDMLRHFECSTWRQPNIAPPVFGEATPATDVISRMKNRWAPTS